MCKALLTRAGRESGHKLVAFGQNTQELLGFQTGEVEIKE